MNFILGVCACVVVALIWMWGVAGFALPERPGPPRHSHEKRDVGDGCVLHIYHERSIGFTKWVACPDQQAVTFDRKSCGKSCSRDESVQVKKETP